MPKLHPIQQSFAAGEISPLMYARSDAAGYRNGVMEMLNMIPDPRGPSRSRFGMKHIGRADGNDARVETIQISESEFFIAVFTDLDLAINTTQGQLPGNNLITNPDFSDGGTGWTTIATTGSSVLYQPSDTKLRPYQPAQSMLTNPDFNLNGLGWTTRVSHPQSSVVFSGGSCFLSSRTQAGNYAGITQSATTQFPGVAHTITIEVETGSDEVEVLVGTAEDDSTYLAQYVTAGTHEFTFTPAASPFWVTINANSLGAGADAEILRVDTAEPTAGHQAGIAQSVTTAQVGLLHRVSVEADITQGQSYQLLLGTSQGDGTYLDQKIGVNTFTTNITPTGATIWITILADYPDIQPEVTIENVIINEPNPGGDDYIRFDTPWLESELQRLQFASAPAGNATYILHHNHPPYKLTYDEATKVWALTQVTFTSPPAQWVTGSYPVTGTVFQGRLWLGGPLETFWGSKSGDLENFTTGVNADDAIEFTLEKYGAIRWIEGLKNLMIGTENAEHIISAVDEVIIPNDVQARQQSSYGSAPIEPIQVGDQVFYISPDRRKVRALQYEWTTDNWLSRDLTFVSEHLTEGLIKSLVWAQNPDNLFLATLLNGDIVSLRYERGEDIYGWSKLNGQGDFKDLSVGSYYGFDEIVGITQIVDGKIDLEYIDVSSDYSLDSWIEVFLDPAGTTVSGLGHLAAKRVQVLTDGAVHPDRIVSGGGTIELQWEASHVVVGLGYDKRIMTLPLDVAGTPNSTMSKMKRRNKIYIKVQGSPKPLINGESPSERFPSTPMNTREPNRTEAMFVANLGFDEDAIVTIEQPLPLDLTLLAIYGEGRITEG